MGPTGNAHSLTSSESSSFHPSPGSTGRAHGQAARAECRQLQWAFAAAGQFPGARQSDDTEIALSKGLDEILSGEPAQVEQPSAEPAEPTPAPEPQPRDEQGKFASKEPKDAEPAPAEPTPQPTAEQPTGRVPLAAVHEERDKRRTAEDRAADLERQVAELNGKLAGFMAQPRPQPAPQPAPETPKPVDFWESPDKFIAQALSPLQAELQQERFDRSVERHTSKPGGAEAVEAAETALRAAIESGQLNGDTVKAQLSQSRDPIGDIVRWHQNQPQSVEARLRAEIEAKVRAELGAANPAPEPPVEQPSTPAPTMPSNLVGQRNVGTRSGPAWSGPASLNDIFDRSRTKKAG